MLQHGLLQQNNIYFEVLYREMIHVPEVLPSFRGKRSLAAGVKILLPGPEENRPVIFFGIYVPPRAIKGIFTECVIKGCVSSGADTGNPTLMKALVLPLRGVRVFTPPSVVLGDLGGFLW